METWAALAASVMAGMAAAAGLTRYAGSLLYGVGPLDAVSFGLGVMIMTLAATAAVALPSLRATRVNPTDALREA